MRFMLAGLTLWMAAHTLANCFVETNHHKGHAGNGM